MFLLDFLLSEPVVSQRSLHSLTSQYSISFLHNGKVDWMDSAIEQIKDHINDKKYFSARWLAYLSAETGLEALLIFQCLAGFIGFYLCFGSQPHFLANTILIIYPLLTQYVYVEEKISRDFMLIYWACWGILTTFDRIMEHIPAYYLVKICLLAMLFLDPWCYCISIKEALLQVKKVNEEDNKNLRSSKKPKSPPPEKPDIEQTKTVIAPIAVKEASTRTAMQPAETPKEVSTRTARLPLEKSTTEPKSNLSTRTAVPPPKSDYIGPEQSYQPVVKATSTMDVSGRKRRSAEENPMTMDRSYRLTVSEGISNKEISFGTNPHDLIFRPMDKLVFNAPFDFDNITYHMKIKNNSHHRIAFAIKGNAIPRILAFPPSAIINPSQEMIIAVTVAKFDITKEDVAKDRIVFEYILLKKSQEHEKEFNHKLLQDAEMKRRKNIRIEYNE